MSSWSRVRTELGEGLDRRRDKRVVHEFNRPGYGHEPTSLQAWLGDSENIWPDTNPQPDNSTPSLPGWWQHANDFDNGPYHVSQHNILSSGQEYNVDLSIPAIVDQNALGGQMSIYLGSNLPTTSFFGTLDVPPIVDDVCYGSVGFEDLPCKFIPC
jgi:hypothetical protein